jgi:soluble lytic murein transglycosylase
LIRARALFGLGHFALAAAQAAKARPALGRLEAHAAVLQAEALIYAGDPQDALEPLRAAIALDPAGPPSRRASALLADSLLTLGLLAEARSEAQHAAEMPGQPQEARAAMAWVAAQSLLGDPARAHEAALAMRAFWLEHPDHPAADTARSIEQSFQPALPEATGRELVARASRLLSAGLPAQAVAQAQVAVTKFAGEERADASLLYARALAADGRRNDATSALEQAWASGSTRASAQAGMLLARDRARRGREAEAIKLADAVARKAPDSTEAEESVLFVARLLTDAGKRQQARARLAKLAAKRSGPNAESARWTLAWMSYRDGLRDAAERFAEFAASASSDDERAQGLYWQARVEHKDTLYQRAAELSPIGWYGMLARQRLGELRDSQAPFPPLRATALAAPAPRLSLALELVDLGLLSEAAAEADTFVREHPGDAEVAALPIYERAGRYDRSMLIADALLGTRGTRAPRPVLEGAYPAAFPAEVGAAATRVGLDPYYLLAVMRRESLFKADARSVAGAVGLLQLLPATARRAATVLGRPPLRDEELVVPATAIDLGAWYLSELVGRFGDPAVALAAYNAGPRVAAPWAAAAVGRPLDEWVEDIPYRETRRYVKAVAGAWSAYRFLAGGEAPLLSQKVPPLRAGANF